MRRIGLFSSALAALAVGMLAQPTTLAREPAVVSRPPEAKPRADKRSKKRKGKVRDIIHRWVGGSEQAKAYALRRNFHAGSSSTLRKTDKLHRLMAGRR